MNIRTIIILALGAALVALHIQGSACSAAEATTKPTIVEETLTNGLRVVYVLMRDVPVVHVRVTYHVGSRDERPDRQGFAHLFEHMMFRGSAHVGADDYSRLIKLAGGSCNATTEYDITSYFQDVPPAQLELALFLEADRMASFRVTDDAYRPERDVVLRELAERREDPYYLASLALTPLVFKDHPYRWSPGGEPAHVAAADIGELQAFFDRYYVPSNAVLVVTGDFRLASAQRLIRKYFQWIERGAKIERQLPRPAPQERFTRAEVSLPVDRPLVLVAVRAPEWDSDDRAAMEVMRATLDSRLNYFLKHVKRPLASSTFVRYIANEDDGVLLFGATPMPGIAMAELERTLLANGEAMRIEGRWNQFLEPAKREGPASLEKQMGDPAACAELLASSKTMRGDVGAGERLSNRLKQLTGMAMVMAAQKYFDRDRMTVLVVRPESSDVTGVTAAPLIARASETPPRPAPRQIRFPADFPTTAPTSAALASSRPSSKPADVPAIVQSSVNDVRLVVATSADGGGVVDWSILIPRGSAADPKGKEGLARLTAALIVQGAEDELTYDWLGRPEAYPIGARIDVTPDITRISGRAPVMSLYNVFQRFTMVLTTPFPPGPSHEVFVWNARRILNEANSASAQPPSAADRALRSALYGPAAPLGRVPTLDTLRAISLADIESCRQSTLHPAGAVIAMHGSVNVGLPHAIARMIVREWKGSDPSAATRTTTAPAAPTASSPAQATRASRPRIIVIDMPEAKQAWVHVGARTFGWGNDQPLLAPELAQLILCERSMKLLRTQKGLTYHVQGEYLPYHGTGHIALRTQVAVDSTVAAAAALIEGFEQLRQSVDEPELVLAKAVYERAHEHEKGIDQQVELCAMGLIRQTDGSRDGVKAQLQAVTPAVIVSLAERYLAPQDAVVVIVGPARQLRQQLEPLGSVEVNDMAIHKGAATRPAREALPMSFQPAGGR